MRMRREVRDLWADALESADFPQAKGALAPVDSDGNPVGFCCLGVLCEVAVREGAIGEGVPEGEVYPAEEEPTACMAYGEDMADTNLPIEVAQWAGIEVESHEWGSWSDPPLTGERDGQPVTRSAATWNDSLGASFAHIAAMVRAIPAIEDEVQP